MAGKKYLEAKKKVEPREYSLEDAIQLLQQIKFTRFDETLEIALRLGVDPRHADQMVRGTVVLPHGLGKAATVCVIASGERVKEAEAAGADFVGGDEIVERIQKGWLGFDAVVATPDMMKLVGRLGRILGPRGMMPNPKAGTVTFDVGHAVREIKAGKVEFRVDRNGVIHAPLGQISFSADRPGHQCPQLDHGGGPGPAGGGQGTVPQDHLPFVHHEPRGEGGRQSCGGSVGAHPGPRAPDGSVPAAARTGPREAPPEERGRSQ